MWKNFISVICWDLLACRGRCSLWIGQIWSNQFGYVNELEFYLPVICKNMFILEAILHTVVGRILRWLPRFPIPVVHALYNLGHSELWWHSWTWHKEVTQLVWPNYMSPLKAESFFWLVIEEEVRDSEHEKDSVHLCGSEDGESHMTRL